VEKWPLVGRDAELNQLLSAVLEKRGAVIAAAAGVGKTTLVTTCLQIARANGMAVAPTTATRASRGLPFGAFASILPPDMGSEPLSWGDHGELLRRYARALIDGAEGRPLVVFVDDAHLLDDGSATLLLQLALTGSATVVAAVRSGEPAPDAVVALWKDGPAERIEMHLLEHTAIGGLLVSVLGAPVDAASVRQFADRCQGNPMVLRELVIGALESGGFADQGGVLRLRGALKPTGRLVELVALRFRDLSDAERSVLELLALGEPLGQATAAELADPASVELLEHKGLVASRLDGRRVQVELAHPVYGDVVRVGISALRERVIARALAERIEAMGARRREDTLLVASLRLAGGGGSAELLLAGAIAARVRSDHPLTERLARAAFDEGGGFDARLIAAEVAHFQGRAEQAETELAALAAEAVDDAEVASVAIARFDNAYLLHGRVDVRLIDQAAAAVTELFWLDELLARRFYLTSLSSGPRATVEAASSLLAGPRPASPTALHLFAYSLSRLGRLGEARERLDSASGRGVIPATDDRWEKWGLFADRARVLIYAGRLTEAEDLLTTAYSQVVGQPAAEARAHVAGQLALLHLEQGRAQSAFLRASESYSLFLQLGRAYPARWYLAAAAEALALAGRADKATGSLAAHDSLDLPPALLNETNLRRARAWTAVATGDLPGARRQLEAAADIGEEIGDLVGATSALHDLARIGRARHVAARLAALADEVEGGLVAARASYATALAARNSPALDKVSHDFETLGAILYAAEASAESAAALRHGGEARKAAGAEQRASRLLARCEGAITPSVRSVTARVRLTPGELAAALQAAAGRTNKEIAGNMQLSVRTVESNLQRVYEKLGISGRHELADALSDGPTFTQ
jgi:DNA-binding CsgD family transcriptional regulator